MVKARSMAKMVETEYNAYIDIDPTDYLGQWVAIFHGKVIAHGTDPKKVYKEASKVSKDHAFMLTKMSASAYQLL